MILNWCRSARRTQKDMLSDLLCTVGIAKPCKFWPCRRPCPPPIPSDRPQAIKAAPRCHLGPDGAQFPARSSKAEQLGSDFWFVQPAAGTWLGGAWNTSFWTFCLYRRGVCRNMFIFEKENSKNVMPPVWFQAMMDFKYLNDRYVKGKERVETLLLEKHKLLAHESLIMGLSPIVEMQGQLGSDGLLGVPRVVCTCVPGQTSSIVILVTCLSEALSIFVCTKSDRLDIRLHIVASACLCYWLDMHVKFRMFCSHDQPGMTTLSAKSS